MTFTADQARKEAKKANRRRDREMLAKQKEEKERREAQQLRAKEDLPEKMEEVLGWIKERAGEERLQGTFSSWSHYGHDGHYYEKLVDLVVEELISLGFAAKKIWAEKGGFRPADDCPIQDVWTYPIKINWGKNRG